MAAPLIAMAVAVGVAVRWLGRVEVVGASMSPTLEPGDRVLLVTARRVRPGQLAVVADPRQPERLLVKRVVSVGPAGVQVAGDNPEASTDSRAFGLVVASAVRGRVVYRYHPAHRRGTVA